MRDARLEKLADVLVRYSVKVKPGDLVMIGCDPIGQPLVESVFEAVLRAGGHPYWYVVSDSLTDILYESGSEEQLSFLSPLDVHAMEQVDVRIMFYSETNTRAMMRVDPKRLAMRRQARQPLMKRFFERYADGEMRWVGTMFPTQASAQDAEMNLAQYERFVFEAGLLHLDDPVAAWEEVFRRQELVREYLQGKKEVRFQVPPSNGNDGTDLTVNVDGGIWQNCAGQENFPDGEVFTGPQGVDGHVNYTFPAVHDGNEVLGVRLEFKQGRVVDARADKNEEFLITMLDQDEGARGLGEIAIGTNYAIKEFTRNTLFDEKIGGTFHAAVGAGYPESGSTNESALHWDMVCDLRPSAQCPGGTIEADGVVFHRDGQFIEAGWPGND